MSIVFLQDETVHYEALGRGRPLVFLHGWVGSWRYWISAMQAASISFRTYALDLWGFGDTAKIPDYYSLEQQVNLVNMFAQEMGLGKIALIGHGLGAVVAMLCTERFKGLVDRVMAVCLPDAQHAVNVRLSTAPPEELAEWLLSRARENNAVRLEVLKTDPKAIQYSLASLQEMNLSGLPSWMTTPCLMVYGQNDPALEITTSSEPAAGQPGLSHQILFDQSGHFPMLDEPNKFNRLLCDFLALSPGASPRQLQVKEEWKRRVR